MNSQKKHWMIATASLLCVFAVGAWLCFRSIPPIQFAQEHKHIDITFRKLQFGDKNGKGQIQWSHAVDHLIGAFNNVYFSLSHVSLDEVRSFRSDLSVLLQGENIRSTETLRKIWKRIGKSGEKGQKYVDRYQPDFETALNAFEESK